MTNIPSTDEFASAKLKMKNRLHNESEIKNKILASIKNRIPCHDIWPWLTDTELTISYVYPKNKDLMNHEQTGIKIDSIIKSTLHSLGFTNVSIEYHSHEHVLEKYNGDYDKYFR